MLKKNYLKELFKIYSFENLFKFNLFLCLVVVVVLDFIEVLIYILCC